MEHKLWGGPYSACRLSPPFQRRVIPPAPLTPTPPPTSLPPPPLPPLWINSFRFLFLSLCFFLLSLFSWYPLLIPHQSRFNLFSTFVFSFFLEPSLSPPISWGSIAPLRLGAFLHCAMHARGCAGGPKNAHGSRAPPDIPPSRALAPLGRLLVGVWQTRHTNLLNFHWNFIESFWDIFLILHTQTKRIQLFDLQPPPHRCLGE